MVTTEDMIIKQTFRRDSAHTMMRQCWTDGDWNGYLKWKSRYERLSRDVQALNCRASKGA